MMFTRGRLSLGVGSVMQFYMQGVALVDQQRATHRGGRGGMDGQGGIVLLRVGYILFAKEVHHGYVEHVGMYGT